MCKERQEAVSYYLSREDISHNDRPSIAGGNNNLGISLEDFYIYDFGRGIKFESIENPVATESVTIELRSARMFGIYEGAEVSATVKGLNQRAVLIGKCHIIFLKFYI